MRAIVAVVLLALAVVISPARSTAEAAVCGGMYRAPAQMLNFTFGRFGTLYAGSDEVGIGNDLGATLDLYRLWHGLPDYNFRRGADIYKPAWMRHQPGGGPWDYPPNRPEWADFALNHALPYALAPNESYLSAGPRDWVASTLDVLTVPGPSLDWWFNPDRAAELSDTEAVIAWHARRSDLLDWLLGAAVQSAYPIFAADQMERERGWPWRKQRDWQEAPDFAPLAARYWARYQADGGLEWAVLAMLFPLDDAQTVAADQLYDQWLARLHACVASPAEYAAFATVYFERSTRDVWKAPSAAQDRLIGLLPPRMQDVMIARAARAVLARQVVSGSWRSGRADLDDARQSLAGYAAFEADDPRRNSQVVQEIRLLFADNIADVADLLVELDSPERFVRDINPLSVSNLQVLAADTRLPKTMRIDLARVVFLRLFAMGRDEDAAEALGRFFTLDPEAKYAAKTAANLTAAPEVKLALIALSMPELSTRYGGIRLGGRASKAGFRAYFGSMGLYGADLPDWLRTGGGLQADVQRLLQVGRFWFSQKGYDYAAMLRLSDRAGGGLFLPEPRFAGFPPLGPYDPGVPFGRLVALDELARLGPDTGLSQRLSEVVIAWADAGSDTLPEMIMQQSGPMPDALRKIVQLNRYRWRGDVDGVFAGKAAFRLLHDRFALTAAARATPYWFVCTGGYCDR